MKKLLSLAAAVLLLCSLLILPAAAGEYIPCVRDYAGLLSAEDAEELENTAGRISAQYGCAVYAVTLDSFAPYGADVERAAENIFYSECPGIDGSCVMLLLSMNERQYTLMAHGDTGNDAFTDYAKELLAEEFLDDFRADDWAGGLEDFVEGTERFLRAAATGEPVDIPQQEYAGEGEKTSPILPCSIFGALAGLVGTGIFSGRMRSVRKNRGAGSYIPRYGVSFSRQQDLYTHTTRTRRRIQTQPQNHGGSGGGTTINSGGFSHKSGSF